MHTLVTGPGRKLWPSLPSSCQVFPLGFFSVSQTVER